MRKDEAHKRNRCANSRKRKLREFQLKHLHNKHKITILYEERVIDKNGDLIG